MIRIKKIFKPFFSVIINNNRMSDFSTMDEEIRSTMLRLMQEHADEDLNVKKIRSMVERELKCDLTDRKAWVRELVYALIAEHFTEDDDGTDAADENEDGAVPQADEAALTEASMASSLTEASEATTTTSEDDGASSEPRGLRLVVPPKLPRGQSTIIQLDDSTIDFQNDTGVIGRVSAQKRCLTMDLKGHQFTAHLRPCSTLLVVGVSGNEAKVETIMDEFCELSGRRNVVKQMSGVLVRGTMSWTGDGGASTSPGDPGANGGKGNRSRLSDALDSSTSAKKQKRQSQSNAKKKIIK